MATQVEELIVEITAELDKAKSDVKKFESQLEKVTGKKQTVRVETEVVGKRDLDALLKDLKSMTARDYAIQLELEAAAVLGDLGKLHNELREVTDTKARIEVQADITKANADLEKITAEAKELQTLHPELVVEVDSSRARQGLDQVAASAKNSKSVLANMVGNAVQDLGALGGIAGSAGVAIGQMGEYMVDAKNDGDKLGTVLKNFAGVAGPIAAIGVGIQLISTVMGGIKAEETFNAALVERFNTALREGKTVIEDIRDTALETGEVLFETGGGGGGGLFGLGSKQEDLVKILRGLGFEADEVLEILSDPRGAADRFNRLAEQQGFTVTDNTVRLRKAAEGLDDYADAEEKANLTEQQRLELVNAAADAQGALSAGLARSSIVARDHAQAVELDAEAEERRQEAYELQRSNAEKTRELLDAAAELEGQRADAVREGTLAMLDAAQASEAFASALDRINQASELDFSLMAFNTVDAFDAMKESLNEVNDEVLDWSKVDFSPEGVEELRGISDDMQAVTTAVAGMRTAIQTELQFAFDTGGIDAYSEKADFFANEILAQFPAKFRELGASEEEAAALTQQLLDELNLLPEDKEIMIKLTHEEQARNALEAFGSFIDTLPEEKQIAIRTAIAQGDIEGALTILNEQLIQKGYPPIVLPIDLGETPPPPDIPTPPPLVIPLDLGVPPAVDPSTFPAVDPQVVATFYGPPDPSVPFTPPPPLPVELMTVYGPAPPPPVIPPVEVETTLKVPDLGPFTGGAAFSVPPVVVQSSLDPSGATEGISDIIDASHETTITAEGDTAPATRAVNSFVGVPRKTTITAEANTAPAVTSINGVVNTKRTAKVDVATGSVDVPSASELARRIGTVRVPVDLYVRSDPHVDGRI